MNYKKADFFRKNPKRTVITVIAVIFCFGFISIISLELFFKTIMGLGNPVIYDSSTLYGYRPLPNQQRSRFWGAEIRINNLGLRAEEDWDEKINDKILFLGDSITYGGSYIDNKELFSSLAVKNLKNFKSGNAGVNAWGVANIYGLIIESKFLPAKIYVTTLAEDDFYRGLTRMQGVPYYNVKPNFALRELWHFFCYKQNNNRYRNWVSFSDEEEKTYVAEKAVKKLKEIENFLKNKGFKFFLFITPTEEQVVNRIEKDELIHNLLFKYKLIPIYIIDKLEGYCMTAEKKHEIFYDGIHLNKKGHKIWAEIIGVELEKIILN